MSRFLLLVVALLTSPVAALARGIGGSDERIGGYMMRGGHMMGRGGMGGGGYMMDGHWGHAGGYGLVALIALVLLLVLIALVIYLVVTARRGEPRGLAAKETAVEILKRRYAAGEIDAEEFKTRKADLEG